MKRVSRRLTVWRVFQNHVLVAGILHAPGDLVQGPAPVLLFPGVAVRGAVQRLFQPVTIGVHAVEGRALGAERALVDRKIRVSLRGNELAVPHIGDDLTANGAERTDRHHFLGAFNLERPGIGQRLIQVDPQLSEGQAQGAHAREFQKISPRTAHKASPCWSMNGSLESHMRRKRPVCSGRSEAHIPRNMPEKTYMDTLCQNKQRCKEGGGFYAPPRSVRGTRQGRRGRRVNRRKGNRFSCLCVWPHTGRHPRCGTRPETTSPAW